MTLVQKKAELLVPWGIKANTFHFALSSRGKAGDEEKREQDSAFTLLDMLPQFYLRNLNK